MSFSDVTVFTGTMDERCPELLDPLREELRNFLTSAGIPVDVAAQVDLATYEVIVNAVEHGLMIEGRPEAICCCCEIKGKKIVTRISYYNEKFDLTEHPQPDIIPHFKEGKKRGLGIYMIRTLMNEVHYVFEEGLNTITMYKTV
jgi:anti-sigma regulatory factor (Ser/Thr protein kinase)